MTSIQQFVTFSLDGLLFGIEVGKIQEVLGYQEMTPVPLAPAAVLGVINLRGRIIVAVDLRRRLGLSERAPGERPVNVVVRSDDDVISLLVDEMEDVVEVAEESLEQPPETMDRRSGILVCSVHKLGRRLMHVLDTDRAVKLPPVEGD
jgi:purine-binding chemotaxis protein CheW